MADSERARMLRERDRERKRENERRQRERKMDRERERHQREQERRLDKREKELDKQLERQRKREEERERAEEARRRKENRDDRREEEAQRRAERQAARNQQIAEGEARLAAARKERKDRRAEMAASGGGSGTVRGGGHAIDLAKDGGEATDGKGQRLEDLDDVDLTDDGAEATWWEKVSNLDWKVISIWAGVALVVVVLFSLLSFILGRASAPARQAAPAKVDSVEGAYSAIDDAESMKDSQIKSLRNQLSQLKEDSQVSAEETVAIQMMNKDVGKTLDPFFEAVLRINRNATASELTNHQHNLGEYVTDSAATSVLYDFLSGPSPARELAMNTRKSGSVIPTWVAVGENESRTYVVVAPFVTDDKQAKALYTVTLNGSGLIDAISYNGLVTGKGTALEDALAKQTTPLPGGEGSSDTASTHGARAQRDGDRPARSDAEIRGRSDGPLADGLPKADRSAPEAPSVDESAPVDSDDDPFTRPDDAMGGFSPVNP